MFQRTGAALIFLLCIFLHSPHCFSSVEVRQDQLWIDGVAQPQIFGAEVQYFRLRGGGVPNIPREKVIALWNQALDRVVEAGMNAVSFYIPWDFHEYAEGKFDFTGTADEDGDGLADYPSRDVVTFIELIKQHGIKNILVRPGPYINAEWGFLGFGAVPLWFHEKHPEAHAINPQGERTTLYSYNNPDFLTASQKWLKATYENVIKKEIGPGKPIHFIQIDNETNFQWQSIYTHDYGARAVAEYQGFLRSRYEQLDRLNAAHSRHWSSWNDVRPPVQPNQNLAEDQDWYRFQDTSIFDYLKKLRSVWSELGVTQPDVLFTLAESYNAADHGLLPNVRYRNSPDVGLMTVNLYPKTMETEQHPLLNFPFKADQDVKSAQAATEAYFGTPQAWSMGPEIQGGWWPGIEVSWNARQQTYLSTIGHGLKAMFVYYFNEGNDWQQHWMRDAILPYFQKLRTSNAYAEISNDGDLPDSFWSELDSIVAHELFVVDTRTIWTHGGTHPDDLSFDAALGGDAKPRAPFDLLKKIGRQIVQPYGKFLGRSHELEDPVCVIKDVAANVPADPRAVYHSLQSTQVQSDLTGGLIALLMHSGINPRIHHWKINPVDELLNIQKCQLIVYQDTGFSSPEMIEAFARAIDHGGAVLSFMGTGAVEALKSSHPTSACSALPILPMNVEGYRCRMGAGALYYAKVPIYDVFNTDFYYLISDAPSRRGVLDRILSEVKIAPKLSIVGGGDRTVAFARASPEEDQLWVTLKTSKREGSAGMLKWRDASAWQSYTVRDVMSGISRTVSGQDLSSQGVEFSLGDSGSTALYIDQAK